MTGDQRYEQILAGNQEKEVTNMCEVAERLENTGKQKGRQEGRQEGRQKERHTGRRTKHACSDRSNDKRWKSK